MTGPRRWWNIGNAAVVATFVAAWAACGERPSASPFAVADSLREEGWFRRAHPLYRALRDSFATTGDSAQWWRAELWWAYTLQRGGQLDSAAAAVAQAFILAGNDPQRVGWTRFMRCGMWSRQGRADSAIAECGRGLEAARAAGDGELEARLHFHLGTIQSRRGRFRLSVAETERALALERQYGRSRYQRAGVLNSMGIEYAAVGRLSEADSAYQEGMRLARTFGTPWYATYLSSNLAYLRATAGDLRGGLDFMNESYRGAEQMADTQAMVYALNSTGEFYQRSGNRAAARAALERAAAINQRILPLYRLITLIDLGLLDLAESRLGPAQEGLTRARVLADESDYALQAVQTRVGLSGVALAQGRTADAVRWADQAVRIADSLASPEVLIDALAAQARAREAAGRQDAAAAYFAGIDLLESWRGRLVLGDLAAGVVDPRWGVYEGAVRLLLARGRADEAFVVAERGRARLLLQVMAERDASRPASTRDIELGRRLRQRTDEHASTEDSTERGALAREIAAITDSLAGLENAGARDPSVAARYPAPASLEEIRKDLARPGQSLVSFFWGDSAVYGWSLSPNGPIRGIRLGRADSLSARVAFVTQALSSSGPDVDWRPGAEQLYRLLLAPLGALEENLVVVPDGPLARLPFEALIPPGQQPLGVTHVITYSPSASVSLALARTAAPATRNRTVLAVGNPALAATVADTGTEMRGQPLDPLPFAEDEARDISRMFREGGSDLLVGRRATLENWRSRQPGRYRYLHFAAHAIVDDRRPDRTRVALAAGDLTLADIRRERLAADLVTLSACETALGRQLRGEGVIGLPHAFLSAGARAVVVTLWRVRDRAAADFMRDFYTEVAGGAAPAVALRKVRSSWVNSGGERSAPSAWAAFVLVGN